MAIGTVVTRGAGVSTTSNSTLAATLTGTVVVGRYLIVSVTSFNIATTDGDSNNHQSMADSVGNTYTKLYEKTNTVAGAAADGVTISTWIARIATQLTTSHSVTITFSGNVTKKTINLLEVPLTSSNYILKAPSAYIGHGNNSLTAATSGLTSRQYLHYYHGAAQGVDTTKTAPTSFTERFDQAADTSAPSVGNETATFLTTNTGQSGAASNWTTTANTLQSVMISFYEVLSLVDVVAPAETDTAQAITTPRRVAVGQATETDLVASSSSTILSSCGNSGGSQDSGCFASALQLKEGVSITPSSQISLGGISFYVGTITGNISAVDWVAEVWLMSGDNLSSLVASSTSKTGLTANAWNNFSFGSPVTLSASTKYGLVVRRSDNNFDASNHPALPYGDTNWTTGETATGYNFIADGTANDVYAAEWAFRILSFASASITVRKNRPVSQVTETSIAQVITPQKVSSGHNINVVQVNETDSPQSVVRRKSRTIAQIIEIDSSQAIGKQKRKAIAQVTDTETAQAITRGSTAKQINVTQVNEADNAQAVGRQKRINVGQVISGGGGDTGGIALANENTSQFTSVSSIVSATSQAKAHGTNGFKALWAGVESGGSGYFSFTAQATDTYVRFYLYIPTGASFDVSSVINIIDIGRNAVFLITDGNGFPTNYRLVTSTGYEDSAIPFTTNTWHCIELAWIKGTGSNGGGKLWIDGQLSNSILNSDETLQSISECYMGIVWSINPASGTYIYFDDCMVRNTYIGPLLQGEISQVITPQKVAGSHNINVVQVTEADLSQAIGKQKRKALSQISENDSSQTISKKKSKSIAQTTESDLAQAVSKKKYRSVTQVVETDLSQAISLPGKQNINVIQVNEVESAQAVGKKKLKSIAQVSETDSSQAISKRKSKSITQITETDLSQSISRGSAKHINVYPAGAFDYLQDENGVYLFDENGVPLYTERQSDFAFGITRGSGHNIPINQVTESDTSQSISKHKSKLIAQKTEADLAQAVSKKKYHSVNQTVETDLARTISSPGKQNINVIQTVENDSAQAIGKQKRKTIQQLTEIDSAQAVSHKKNKIVNQTTESNSADAINVSGKVNPAMETDTAFVIRVLRKIPVAQVNETDIVQTISKLRRKVLSQVTEIDLAGGITVKKYKQIQQASENDSTQAISKRKKYNIGFANEFDISNPVYTSGAHLIALLTTFETDKAFTIRTFDPMNTDENDIEGEILDNTIEGELSDYPLEVTYANLNDPYLQLADADGKDFYDADNKEFYTADRFITNESIEVVIE